MTKYGGIDDDPGWINRKLAQLDTAIAELSAAKRLVFSSTWAQNDINSMDFTSSFAPYAVTTVPTPAGYNFVIVQMYVTAGVTAAGSSSDLTNVGCQARVGSSGAIAAGPAISNGRQGVGAVSCSAGLATKLPLGAGSLNLYINAYAASGGALASGSGNVHLSASLIFTRA